MRTASPPTVAAVDTNNPWESPTLTASPILQLQHYLRGRRAYNQQGAGDLEGFRQWVDDNAGELGALLVSNNWLDEPQDSPKRLCGEAYYSGLTGVLSSLVSYKPFDAIFLNAAWALLRERAGQSCLKRGVRRSASYELMRPDWSSHLGSAITILACHPFANDIVTEALAWVDTNTLRHAFKYGFLLGGLAQDTPQGHAQHVCALEHARACCETRRAYQALQKGGGLVDGSSLQGQDRRELYFDSWGQQSAYAKLKMEEKIALSNPSQRNDAAWLLSRWDQGIRHYYTQLVENCESYPAEQLANEALAAKEQLQSHLIERLSYYRSALESNELPLSRKIYNELGALLERVYLDRANEADQQEVAILHLEEKVNPDELITEEHFTAAQGELQACIAGIAEGPLKQQAQTILDQANRMYQSSSDALQAAIDALTKRVKNEKDRNLKKLLEDKLPRMLKELNEFATQSVSESCVEQMFTTLKNRYVFTSVFSLTLDYTGQSVWITPYLKDSQIDLNDCLYTLMQAQYENNIQRIELTHTFHAMTKALQAPNPAVAGEYLKRHAKKIQGRPSRGWRILGALLMALGACLCVAGVAIAVVTAVPSLGLGTVAGIKMAASGAAVSSFGAGLFYHHRQKGLSKSVDSLGKVLSA